MGLKPVHRSLQIVTETLTVIVLLMLGVLPIARLGAIPLAGADQILVQALASLLLILGAVTFRLAGYRSKAPLETLAASRRRDDAILNALTIATTVLLAIIAIVELVALLVFVGAVRRTAPAVVTAAGYFDFFATFILLYLDLILVARTTFDSRHRGRRWHPWGAYVLFGFSVLLLIMAALKSQGLLQAGALGQIKAEQGSYILVIAVFLQLIAYRLLLRYPSLTRVFQTQLEHARKADKEQRKLLERRAVITYVVGLAFVLVSFLLIGGVATGQVSQGNQQTTTTIILVYVGAGLAVLLFLAGRYVQHRYLKERQRRQEKGELIARRRMTPEQVADLVIYTVSGLFAFLLLILAVLTFMGATPFRYYIGTDLLILSFLVGVGPFGFRRALRMRRVHLMDAKFPDFLRDLAEGVRAGMTLPRALYAASRGVYGHLTPEIKHMSGQVEWGVSFSEALDRFSKRVKTPLIERTVSLVTEASRAGGSVVDILTAASNDAREIQQILDDRKRQMGIYSVIIYVAFFVFLVVVYVLAVQFLPAFELATKGAANAPQVGGFSFGGFDRRAYIEVFFHAALVQGVGGGLVAGVMTEGHPLGGLKHSFIMAVVSWLFFRVLV